MAETTVVLTRQRFKMDGWMDGWKKRREEEREKGK